MASATLSIDLDAIAANWRALDRLSDAATQTAAVVKADAYGLGTRRVGRALATAGARRFFVAIAEEGALLRQALGPGPQICVLSGHMPGDTEMVQDLDLTPVLNSIDQFIKEYGVKGYGKQFSQMTPAEKSGLVKFYTWQKNNPKATQAQMQEAANKLLAPKGNP